MGTVHYFPGQPGEVSYQAARDQVAHTLANPFTTGATLQGIADAPVRLRRQAQRGRRIIAAGALMADLKAAALRELTQGEG